MPSRGGIEIVTYDLYLYLENGSLLGSCVLQRSWGGISDALPAGLMSREDLKIAEALCRWPVL